MPILRIEELVYGVENIEECSDFLKQWGLTEIDSNKTKVSFKTLENQNVILKKLDDPSLPPTYEDGATLR